VKNQAFLLIDVCLLFGEIRPSVHAYAQKHMEITAKRTWELTEESKGDLNINILDWGVILKDKCPSLKSHSELAKLNCTRQFTFSH